VFEVKDKIIVVTGSNGLLGKDISSSLQAQGAMVLGADVAFTRPAANDFVMDITSEASVKDVVAKMIGKFERIDGWVNNAYPRTSDWGKKLEDIPFESWQKNIDMHLNGYFLCSRIALEQMRKQRSGSLVNMSSIYGHLGPDFGVYDGTDMTMPAAYSAIKGAITNFTRYLASYYGKSNVRVNSISPGGVFANQPESFVSAYEKKVPLGRMATPKDIVAAVHFLLSDESSYITGQNLVVDGGWSII
jgi:NAD(P)-dependent dehydrogenase (short-subunit alcohol dehydrogenase family)